MNKETNFLSENNCKDIMLRNRSQYLYILNTIQKDTAKITIIQVTGEDKGDPVVNTAEEMMHLEKREKVHKWPGTIQTDNGTEFTYKCISDTEICPFDTALEVYKINHKLIPLKTP